MYIQCLVHLVQSVKTFPSDHMFSECNLQSTETPGRQSMPFNLCILSLRPVCGLYGVLTTNLLNESMND